MTVVVAHLTPGMIPSSFQESLLESLAASDVVSDRLQQASEGGDVAGGRNRLVSLFLERTNADWLWMLDTDMKFAPDTVDRLLASADVETRPVVSGLIFGQRPAGVHAPFGTAHNRLYPAMYRKSNGELAPIHDYPVDDVIEVDATDASCLLVHRRVLEQMRESRGPHWWAPPTLNDRKDSEGLSFCLHAVAEGIPIHVDTSVQTARRSETFLDEYTYRHQPRPPTAVIIPVKNRLDLTKHVVGQIGDQGGFDLLAVYDHGSDDGTAGWLQENPYVTYIDASDATSIHQMWNAGVDRALRLHSQCQTVFLNNDVDLGPRFLKTLTDTLADSPYTAISPNYDGRPRTARHEPLRGISSGRYDGTGGLAGFAFAVDGSWFEGGYRFPEECRFWYGDDDLVASLNAAGHQVGMALDCRIEHVDGGGQTGAWNDAAMLQILDSDRAWFEEKWSDDPAMQPLLDAHRAWFEEKWSEIETRRA